MLAQNSLIAWTILSIGLVLIPGPDTMIVAGNAARHGWQAGLRAIGGISLGGLLYMALCGFGFLALLNAVPGAFMAVKIAGAAYLLWMGFQLVRGAIKPAEAEAKAAAISGSAFRQGFLSTVLNPKVAIFFLAALPQFVGTGPDAPAHGALLIAVSYGLGGCWLAFVALLASQAGRRASRSGIVQRFGRWFEGALGAAFIGLAGRLALTRNA
jgi:threonine/homoserine/homoserine lactone efflux protein